MKKHKNYKPQKRRKLKITTGKLISVDMVYMDREKIEDPETGEKKEMVYATCTCGKWRSSNEATTIQKVALEAKAHVESGSGCIFRPHEAEPEEHPLEQMTENTDADQ